MGKESARARRGSLGSQPWPEVRSRSIEMMRAGHMRQDISCPHGTLCCAPCSRSRDPPHPENIRTERMKRGEKPKRDGDASWGSKRPF